MKTLLGTLSGRGFRVLLGVAFGMAVLLFASSDLRAQCPGTCTSPNGCNGVTIKVTLQPLKVGIDKVGLVTSCGGAVVKSCGPFSFATTVGMTLQTKCQMIRDALNVAACTGIGYSITDNCLDGSANPHSITVSDSCGGGVLEFTTTNESGSVFTSNNGSTSEVDYEMNLITPSCKDEDNVPGNGNDIVNQVTLAGIATGVPINGAEPAHEEVTVDQSANGGPVVTAEVNTSAGMTSASIIRALQQSLIAQGVPESQLMITGTRALRIVQPTSGNPIKVGIADSDTGLVHDSRVAPRARLPIPSPVIPTLSTWGTILLVASVLLTSLWWMRRRRGQIGQS